mmetsp:Transcript_52697/g.133802  ORF Transcript_52697/g.133802 Transcript_52697/m.133802 type:complete len:279 (-) Transcript_52697:109-945(-)
MQRLQSGRVLLVLRPRWRQHRTHHLLAGQRRGLRQGHRLGPPHAASGCAGLRPPAARHLQDGPVGRQQLRRGRGLGRGDVCEGWLGQLPRRRRRRGPGTAGAVARREVGVSGAHLGVEAAARRSDARDVHSPRGSRRDGGLDRARRLRDGLGRADAHRRQPAAGYGVHHPVAGRGAGRRERGGLRGAPDGDRAGRGCSGRSLRHGGGPALRHVEHRGGAASWPSTSGSVLLPRHQGFERLPSALRRQPAVRGLSGQEWRCMLAVSKAASGGASEWPAE